MNKKTQRLTINCEIEYKNKLIGFSVCNFGDGTFIAARGLEDREKREFVLKYVISNFTHVISNKIHFVSTFKETPCNYIYDKNGIFKETKLYLVS